MRRTLALLAAIGAALAVADAGSGAVGIALSPTSTSTPTVTLNGVDQEPAVTIRMTVSGANQNGWKITAWAPVPTSSGKTLPALEVPSQPSQNACSGFGCTNAAPTGISWPVTLGTTSGAASKIYNAAAATGDGTIVINVPFGVTVPANALPGFYTTTIRVAISSGP